MREKTEHQQKEKGQTRSMKDEGVEERVVSSKKTRNDKVKGGSHGLHIFFSDARMPMSFLFLLQ